MKISEFPHQHEYNVRCSTHARIDKERELSSHRCSTIRSSITKKTNSTDSGIFGAIIGFIIGFFACCGICINTDKGGSALATWVVVSIIGAIIGVVSANITNSNHANSVEYANNEVDKESKRSNEAITKMYNDAEREIKSYKINFEAEAERLSIKYSKSRLATEVIDWMSKGFSKTIDTADRRSHIKSIDVPFSFKVYPNKISCPFGTYDFEIKRCANLNSPLEQAAIARAIASTIRLNITMKYPKDASGTDHVFYISYTYEENYVIASVLYTAPNGYYRPVQQW